MIFTELRFFLFFALVLGVHWALRGDRSRKLWLLAASYTFYGAWNWRYLGLILLSTVVDYFAGAAISAAATLGRRRFWLIVSLVVNLGILGTFKYYDFFAESASELLQWMGFGVSMPVLNVLLPVGISFYTFQTMSYTLDIYGGRLKPTRDAFDFALFVSFFPQLVAGPIVRAREFLPQLTSRRVLERDALRPLLVLFAVGFFKKSCIGDNLAPVIDAYYSAPASFDLLSTWTAVLLFWVQMYADFSGYTDMAIATAGLLGYHLPKNFDYPLMATSVREFWRRWHMTLFAWFRDYVYIPMGGSRGSKLRTNSTLLATTMLIGLWHGAAWHYVLWGSTVAIMIFGYRFLGRFNLLAPVPAWLQPIVGVCLTYWVTSLSVVVFRAPDMPVAGEVFALAFGFQQGGERAFGAGPLVALVVLGVVHWISYRKFLQPYVERAPSWVFAGGLGFAIPVMLAFTSGALVPFEYFQF